MDQNWTFEACCSRGWAAFIFLIALGLMGAGMLAAAWGFLNLEEQAGARVLIASAGGSVAIFVFGAAALIAFADVVRPREPVIIVDAFGILDRRVAPSIIPWAAIRTACRRGRDVALHVEGWDDAPSPAGVLGRWLGGSSGPARGAITISTRGLTCAADDVEAAVRRGLTAHAAEMA